jgi:hypothetical protein
MEPDWISFHEAATEIQRVRGLDRARARQQLRAACADERIHSRQAPYETKDQWFSFAEPSEYWRPIKPSEWRNGEVDYDNHDTEGNKVMVMLSEVQFRDWLATPPKPQSLRLVRKQRKRDAAKAAIAALWPRGIPEGVSNSDLECKVGAWLKEKKLTAPSRDTILRATGRK